jgi:large subunit ribosomal protein L17
MRHGNHKNKLSRKTGHRIALFRNLSSSLLIDGRIETTVAKAKAMRSFLEPIITKSINAYLSLDTAKSLHYYRLCEKKINNDQALEILFHVSSRLCLVSHGGYLRIIRSRQRQGDAAEMAYIEFVIDSKRCDNSLASYLDQEPRTYAEIVKFCLNSQRLRYKYVAKILKHGLPKFEIKSIHNKNNKVDLVLLVSAGTKIREVTKDVESWPVRKNTFKPLRVRFTAINSTGNRLNVINNDKSDTDYIAENEILIVPGEHIVRLTVLYAQGPLAQKPISKEQKSQIEIANDNSELQHYFMLTAECQLGIMASSQIEISINNRSN